MNEPSAEELIRAAVAKMDREIDEKKRKRDQLMAMISDGASSAPGAASLNAPLPAEVPVTAAIPHAPVTLETEPPKRTNEVVVGTLANLIHRYRTDEGSPYHKIKHATRVSRDGLLNRIVEECGDRRLADLMKPDLQLLYDNWSKDNKISMGQALIGTVRTLAGFGAGFLENTECQRLCGVLGKMRFKIALPRNKASLNAAQATALREQAHKQNRGSIALAQAFQFDCGLHQIEVIGEWVPAPKDEPVSELCHGGKKWATGLRWEEIDEDLILRHPIIGRGQKTKITPIDLKRKPMVWEELKRLPASYRRVGPIIISEHSGVPYTSSEYRRQWRKIATQIGVPKEVYNMDLRAGETDETVVGKLDSQQTVSTTLKWANGNGGDHQGLVADNAETKERTSNIARH